MNKAYLLLAAVYIAGLFVPLMDNDAGEYALIALNMVQKNDFINIVRKGQDYLDKPHLLFWLAALSFKIFGVSGLAYKLPSLLFSLLAIYSTNRLATILFNKQTGALAGLILGYAQAFIIANYDVRTDAILTGATIFSIYQFIRFSTNKKYVHLIAGALGLALAVGTKGLIAVIVTGSVIVLHLLYHQRLKEVLFWRWLSSIAWFFLFLSPFLYCYYLQFDAHPEKITNGVKGMSGVKFLLWTQSFERLAGQRNMVNNNDVLFFFHTFLWAFLPWSIMAYYETFRDWVMVIKNKFRPTANIEFALSGGVLLIMLLMSTSQFKLPHYLNILFPLFAIISAKSLFRISKEAAKIPLWIKIFFYVVCGVYALGGILLNTWAFPLHNIVLITGALTIVIIAIIFIYRSAAFPLKPVFTAMLTVGIVNFFLNVNFFPGVLAYQGSVGLARYVNSNKVPVKDIISYTSRAYFAFDFYVRRDIPEAGIKDLVQRSAISSPFYLLTEKGNLTELKDAGISIHPVKAVPHFHVSRLSLKFLNPSTRWLSLDSLVLLKVDKENSSN